MSSPISSHTQALPLTVKPCHTECNLEARVTSLGYALLSTAEAVSRAAACNIALLGYALTLGYWEEAYTFGTEQLTKAYQASSSTAHHLYQTIWPLTTLKPLTVAVEPTAPARPAQIVQPTLSIRAQLIASKLQRQYDRAQEQAQAEEDKSFTYKVAPEGPFPSPWADPNEKFDQADGTERICGLETGFCHYSGRRDEMEDEHLSTSITFQIKGETHTAAVFGVFDGHCGKEAAIFTRDHLKNELQEALESFCEDGLTQETIRDALKQTFRDLDEKFQPKKPGTTAAVAMILKDHLWTANVGDSRIIADNGIQLTEDAKPNDPNYLKRIEKLGGYVLGGRVDANLSVARAIGDHSVKGMCAEAKIIDRPLSEIPENSHLILACDGIYEVASTRQIAEAVSSHKELSALDLARNLVYSAYRSYSQDNLTALVVKLKPNA